MVECTLHLDSLARYPEHRPIGVSGSISFNIRPLHRPGLAYCVRSESRSIWSGCGSEGAFFTWTFYCSVDNMNGLGYQMQILLHKCMSAGKNSARPLHELFRSDFSDPMPQPLGYGAQLRSPAERVRMIARHRWTGIVRLAEVSLYRMPADVSGLCRTRASGDTPKGFHT